MTSVPREKFLAKKSQKSTFFVNPQKKICTIFPELLKYVVVTTINGNNQISILDKINFNV